MSEGHMSPLLAAMRARNYTFRQHLDEVGWGERKLTVVDLEATQRAALESEGLAGLARAMQDAGRWTFPAAEILPHPQRADLVLARDGVATAAVVAPAGGELGDLARRMIDALRGRLGVSLELIADDSEAIASLLGPRPLIVLGGSHENRAALAFALRYRTGFVDASVPGEGGWIVTMHAGLDASGHNVLQVAGSAEHHPEMLAHVLENVAERDGQAVVGYVHRIAPGAALAARFPSWEQFAASLPGKVPIWAGRTVEAPMDPVALSHVLAEALDSGGPKANLYNAAPIDLALLAARYYQISGDERGLTLFRALLFRLADYYLKTPEGASYISDMDFRLGPLLLYYARLEHHPIFTAEDRLILTNLLLACLRAIYEYTITMWPLRETMVLHNHQTFKALTLTIGAAYFERYGIEGLEAWRAYGEAIFGRVGWQRSKQSENANLYELFVFDHMAAWTYLTGRPATEAMVECLRQVVQRQIAATDNFLRPVDYGDSAVKMSATCAGMARLVALHDRDPLIRWFAEEDLQRTGDDLPSFIHEHPGLRQPPSAAPAVTSDWELCPLDPAFAADYAPELPGAYGFDKLAFRTGWGGGDQYLLWEGVGNLKVGHAHNEAGGIVRFNHRGRHWLVSNGYGRRVGVTNVSKSFSSRVRGPEDHNMLVLHRGGELVRELPACAALLQHGRQGTTLWATTAVLGYGGVDWFRTLVLQAGGWLLVIDRLRIAEAGLERAHVEFNTLGTCSRSAQGFTLEQAGEFLHVSTASGWASSEQEADRSACWQRVLDSGQYPFASFPLRKLVFEAPEVSPGRTVCLATLVAAGGDVEPAFHIEQPEAGRIIVSGSSRGSRVDIADGDLRITGEAGRCEIALAAAPELPEALAPLTAAARG